MAEDTINDILQKDNVRDIAEELANSGALDVAVVYVTKDKNVASRWTGDKLKLVTLCDILREDLMQDILTSKDE